MNELTVTEFKGIRVLTTQQLAESYGTDSDTINKNFNNNIRRYIEGKHYILLQGEELREEKAKGKIYGLQSNANKFYLWTEKGTFLHAKSLNTDTAWEVYDRLVDTYFQIKESKPNCLEDVLIASLQEMKSMREQIATQNVHIATQKVEIDSVTERVESIRDLVSIDTSNWREETRKLLNAIGYVLGGGQAYANVRSSSYELLELRMGVSLSRRLVGIRNRLKMAGASEYKINNASNVDVIAEDKKLIEGYMAIVKEMAIKYNVA